jgi:phage recombination protein Bet
MAKKTKKDPKKKKKKAEKEPGTAMMPREEAETLTKKANARKRILLIKRQFMPRNASEDELAMFLTVCKRKALDPFLGHITCSRIDGKLVFMTSIDALRLIAQRPKCYAPSPKPAHYEYKKDGSLLSCTVWVLKYVDGQPVEYSGIAFYDEQVGRKGDGTLKKIWQRMPRHMLAIRAESFALRRGFPAELSGLYTKEEIEDSVMKEITPEAISEANGSGVQRAKDALKAPDPEAPKQEAQKPEAPEEAGGPILDAEFETVEGNGEPAHAEEPVAGKTVAQEAADSSALFKPECRKCGGTLVSVDVDKGKCVDEKCELGGQAVAL